MEIRQLTTFRMITQTLSFSRAASNLNYAQSTVSAQIQSLEEELGVSLFDRLGKRVTLTDAGQNLLTYAEKILSLAEEAEAIVSNKEALTGTLTLSAPETLCTYRLPRIFRQFRQRFPEVQLTVCFDFGTTLSRSLTDGGIDLAFLMEEPIQSPSLKVESLIPERLLVVAPPHHPLAEINNVNFQDLQDEPLIQTESECTYRKMFETAAAAAGVHLFTPMEFHSIETIKQCVMAGLGLSFLPEIAVTTEINQGRLVPLDWSGRDFQVATQMVWHKDKWLSPAMEAFLALSRELLGAKRLKI